MMAGTHQWHAKRRDKREREQCWLSANSTVMIGTSAAISAGARGVVNGAALRTDAIRTAIPNEPLTMLATQPNAAERNSTLRPTVPPAARTQMVHASVRLSSAPIWSSTESPTRVSGAVRRAALNCEPCPAST